MSFEYFDERKITSSEVNDPIIISGSKILIDRKVLEDTIDHTEYLLRSLKRLYGNMTELENKKTTLSEFEKEFHKLVADAEKILTRKY